MANRARDKVIYIRVDEALKKRFDRIKEADCLYHQYISGSVLGYSVSGNQCIFKEDRRPAVEDYREVVMR